MFQPQHLGPKPRGPARPDHYIAVCLSCREADRHPRQRPPVQQGREAHELRRGPGRAEELRLLRQPRP